MTIENLKFDEKIAFNAVKEAEAALIVVKTKHEKSRFLLEAAEQGYKAREAAARAKAQQPQ